MNDKLKLAMCFFSSTQLQTEIIDELQGTNLYKHRLKNLGNQIQKENEKIIESLYDGMDDECEKYFNQTTIMVETLLSAVKKGNIGTLIELLACYRDGSISVVDETKHKKILDKMPKL